LFLSKQAKNLDFYVNYYIIYTGGRMVYMFYVITALLGYKCLANPSGLMNFPNVRIVNRPAIISQMLQSSPWQAFRDPRTGEIRAPSSHELINMTPHPSTRRFPVAVWELPDGTGVAELGEDYRHFFNAYKGSDLKQQCSHESVMPKAGHHEH
jgi:hypothetical protein